MLVRDVGLPAELACRVPGPGPVAQQLAAERHGVRLAVREDFPGLLELDDHPDRAEQIYRGTAKMNELRRDDLDALFPGLLDSVLAAAAPQEDRLGRPGGV
ncbi:hypothetical protein OG883_35410 [Streptomyces sp. NBC_01142]|uniref:hypothetical protein n=1 Tax=Streptomyces sp. NBC_01142 TaxID=2975865 RepID=UPI00225B28EF|nr:hypothetical protein [Streptomyces sp. NBC_01142]MCX4825059.1 hypothetical protein [Streptomyces sp. NBC_01142]